MSSDAWPIIVMRYEPGIRETCWPMLSTWTPLGPAILSAASSVHQRDWTRNGHRLLIVLAGLDSGTLDRAWRPSPSGRGSPSSRGGKGLRLISAGNDKRHGRNQAEDADQREEGAADPLADLVLSSLKLLFPVGHLLQPLHSFIRSSFIISAPGPVRHGVCPRIRDVLSAEVARSYPVVGDTRDVATSERDPRDHDPTARGTAAVDLFWLPSGRVGIRSAQRAPLRSCDVAAGISARLATFTTPLSEVRSSGELHHRAGAGPGRCGEQRGVDCPGLGGKSAGRAGFGSSATRSGSGEGPDSRRRGGRREPTASD